jgi:4-hydroxybenzoate polyprenyltransferase
MRSAGLRHYIALSRLPHVLLDIATPAMAALLWIGYFPAARTVLLGLFSAFAGYTAVYALNDLVDRHMDRTKMDADDSAHRTYLDAVAGRHPVARGLLSVTEGWVWIAFWGVAGLVSAYLLRPVCVGILLIGAALEAIYCTMYRITPLRTVVSGIVKTLGGIAAVFTVDPQPNALRLGLLVCMVFFWEIGGQNIPADWTDIDEDKRMRARTIPVHLGALWAAVVIACCLGAALVASVALFRVFSHGESPAYQGAVIVAGVGLLTYPSILLFLKMERTSAQTIFNRASFYPLALLAIATVKALA